MSLIWLYKVGDKLKVKAKTIKTKTNEFFLIIFFTSSANHLIRSFRAFAKTFQSQKCELPQQGNGNKQQNTKNFCRGLLQATGCKNKV